VRRAFPERSLALLVTLALEIPVAFIITGGSQAGFNRRPTITGMGVSWNGGYPHSWMVLIRENHGKSIYKSGLNLVGGLEPWLGK